MEELLPQKIQHVVKEGFERMKVHKRATAMFVKEYAGQYYSKHAGLTGDSPINMLYNAIRAIVPNLVMKSPVNLVTTRYTQQKQYAGLLSLGLDSIEKTLKLKDTLRAWIVAALFGWGIIKVGVSSSGQMLKFGDINVDPGQIYADLVSIDNFVIDPTCSLRSESSFQGHKTMVPRQLLLDTDVYNHDLVARLPSSTVVSKNDKDRLSDITKLQSGAVSMNNIQDYVDVIELHVPEANALITIPDPYQTTFDEYISMEDYYGPKEGPYVDLSFSQPVPGQPFPIAPVSMIFDLHRITNEVFNKVVAQSLGQKDVVLYNPANADEMEDLRDSDTGDFVKSNDPKAFQTVSIGGQNQSNEIMLQELQMWFNYMAANPDQLSGNTKPGGNSKESATKSSILQNNASIGVEDARGILYDRAAEVSKRLAWFLHTDPLIDLPITKRKIGGEEIQLELTPEQRCGDFLDFAFEIKQRSMSQLPPDVRAKRIFEFGVNLLPNAVNAAMLMMQMGRQFNLEKYLTMMAREAGIEEEIEDLFFDPEFQERMELMMMLGPQNAGKAGDGKGSGGGITPGAMTQNGSMPSSMGPTTPAMDFNSNSQVGAAGAQSDMRGMG